MSGEPPCKKAPQDMSKEELVNHVLELEQELAAKNSSKKVIKTDLEYFNSLIRLEFHGKSTQFLLKSAYKYRRAYNDFYAPRSIEYYIASCLTDEEKIKCFQDLTQNKYFTFCTDVVYDKVFCAEALIAILHCFGVQCNKYGYSKPRSLGRKTLYEYILENAIDDKALMYSDIDSVVLRITAGHVLNEIILRNLAEQMIEFVRTLKKQIMSPSEEAEEVE